MTAADPVIDTRGLAKRYGRTEALIDLSLRVESGEIFGFLGPNGAGKTTAVKLLLGLARPTGGSGSVLGAPLGDRVARREIGYLPELFRYQPWLRAREVVELHAALRSVDGGGRRGEVGGGGRRGEVDGGGRRRAVGAAAVDAAVGAAAVDAAAVDAALTEVGLADRADDLVGGFSKGMQQRLGLAVALLGAPRLVVLDEPTSALDPVGRADVRSIVRRARDAGSTILLNSHLLTEVERVCDRVAIVDHGRVLASGKIDDLLGEPTVRIRVTGLPSPAIEELRRFGSLEIRDEGWLTFTGLHPERVPDVVEAIVTAGGRVHAIDAGRATLEDLFMRLVGGGDVSA
jgi:ABC-2 type transport system ATP-binding protein